MGRIGADRAEYRTGPNIGWGGLGRTGQMGWTRRRRADGADWAEKGV